MVKGVLLCRAFLCGEHGLASRYLKNGTVCVPVLTQGAMWEDAFGRCEKRRHWVVTVPYLQRTWQGLILPAWLRSVSKGTIHCCVRNYAEFSAGTHRDGVCASAG